MSRRRENDMAVTATRAQVALIERALRFTVGEDFGGVGTEAFTDSERDWMLRAADLLHVGLREREVSL